MVENWSYELEFDAEWVEGEVDHKKLSSNGVDFDTKSQVLEKYRQELARGPYSKIKCPYFRRCKGCNVL